MFRVWVFGGFWRVEGERRGSEGGGGGGLEDLMETRKWRGSDGVEMGTRECGGDEFEGSW